MFARIFLIVILFMVGMTNAMSDEFWPLRNYDIRNWSVNDGLPQVSVYDIAKDNKGYLWLATEKGLVRFDGHSFKTYSRENTPLLENPRIKKLLWNAKSNELLVATDSSFFRLKDNIFSAIDTSQTPSHRVLDMQLLSDGVVYVAAGGLFEYRDGQLLAQPFQLSDVSQLAEIRGRLCLSTNTLFGCISGSRFIGLGAPFPEHWQIHHIVEYQDKVLLGTEHGLYRLSDNQTWQPVTLAPLPSDTRIRALFKQNPHTLWVGTDTHLHRIYNNQLQESLSYQDDPIISLVLNGFTDEQGTLWLGTQISGLIKTELNAASHIPTSAGISEAFIWSVATLNDRLLVGTASGLYQETVDNQFEPLSLNPEPNNRAIYSLLNLPDSHELWVGTKGGLSVYDTRQFTQIRNFKELARIQVNSIVRHTSGHIWIGTQNGLWVFDGQKLTPHADFQNNQYGGVRFIFMHNDTLWIGTERGLFKQHSDGFQPIQHDILGKTFISFIGQLNDGKMMVGTFQHGLFLEQPDNTWLQRSIGNGLPMDNITYLAQVDDKLLWAGLQGITVIDLGSLGSDLLKFSVLVDNTGASPRKERHRCCNGAGANKGLTLAKTSYFPTVNGLLKVEHDLLSIPPPATKPLFEEFEANNNIVSAPYILSPEDKDWRFKFTSPTYNLRNELEFRYQLQGYDKTWKYTKKLREANYTNLSGGDYIFKVQARLNGYPKWSELTEVHLTKNRTWYEMWWFYLVTLLLILFLFVAAWKARSRAMLAKQRELRTEVEKRTAELYTANQRLLEMNEQLRDASLKDALTGLKNRRFLTENLDQVLTTIDENQSLTLLVVDIDNFKKINDEYGHNVGDDVLITFSHLLAQLSSKDDHVLRWGGEEFLIIVDHSTPIEDFAVRLTHTIRQTQWPQGIPVRASIGLFSVTCNDPSMRLFELTLAIADQAMYAVKSQSKDSWLWLKTKEKVTQEQLEQLHNLDFQALTNSAYISTHTEQSNTL